MPTSDVQIRTYAGLRSFEARAQALEELLASLKRRCLHGGPAALEEIVVATGELRWQLRLLQDRQQQLEAVLGVVRDGSPMPEQRAQPRDAGGMRGSTDVLSVADLVGMLSNLRKTGTLTLQAGDTMFVFEFQGGAVVHAVTNRPDSELRLGTILVAQNKITAEMLQQQLRESAGTNTLLGDQLVQSQTVTAVDLRTALEVQVRRIFEQAFDLAGARFHFVEGSLSAIAERANLNTTHLLLEAARQNDERRREPELVAASRTRNELDSILPD